MKLTLDTAANDLQRIFRWLASRFVPGSARGRPARPLDLALELPVPEEPRAPGCGWFDSSHDLRQGLSVHEHATVEAIAQELPLAAWLDWHMGSWRPTLAA